MSLNTMKAETVVPQTCVRTPVAELLQIAAIELCQATIVVLLSGYAQLTGKSIWSVFTALALGNASVFPLLCFMLLVTYYASNYASIIGQGLTQEVEVGGPWPS